MKSSKTSTVIIALVAVMLSVFAPKQSEAQPFGGVSFDLFYHELSPYGYWERDRMYGDIWFPARVSRDFRPYGTNGYWTMTEYGNTWVSGYDWGWATFHYGRWVYTDYNGWGWIPGYEWGPAWVDWRTGGGYYGWAPMAPHVNVYVSMPIDYWVFLPTRRIYDHRINRYWSYGQPAVYHRTTIINNTYIVNNNHYYGGPGRRDIEHHIGRPVEVRTIRTTDHRGASRVDNRTVSMYRPDNSRTSTRTGTAESVRSDRNTVGTRESTSGTRGNTVGTREGTSTRGATESRTGTRGNTESTTGSRGGTISTRENSTSTRGSTESTTGSRGGTISTRENSTSTRGNTESTTGSRGGTISTRENSTSTRGNTESTTSSRGNATGTNATSRTESSRTNTSSTRGAGDSSRGSATGTNASSRTESSRTNTSSTRGAGDSSRGSSPQTPVQVDRSSSSSRGQATESRGSGSSTGERRTR